MRPTHFHFLTLFPEVIHSWMGKSILGRAVEKGILNFSTYQLRDFSTDKYRSVDDSAYGGGGGMVLRVDCLVSAIEHIRSLFPDESTRVIYFSPAGTLLNQETIERYNCELKETHLILVCGHYEGVDQRFVDHWVDEEISLGDFVLTGGELPALAFADSLSRQLSGTLSRDKAHSDESFSLQEGDNRLLEYPHYTRPPLFRDHAVPEVLLQGDHGKIAEWRKKQALSRTLAKRPDLLGL
jgi:tRNA (guanine37-N1)-methyltransferase